MPRAPLPLAPTPAHLRALPPCCCLALAARLRICCAGLAASVTHKEPEIHPEMSNPLGAEAVALANLDPAYASHTEPDRRRPGNAFEHAAAEVLNWRSENIVAAGAELGLWMCLAFGLEVLGVQVRRCKAQEGL